MRISDWSSDVCSSDLCSDRASCREASSPACDGQHDRQDVIMARQSKVYTGIGFALGSAALFGVSTPMAKLLLGGISPWLMAGLLYLGAGFGLAMVRLLPRWRGKPAAEAPWAAVDLRSKEGRGGKECVGTC